MDFQLIYGEMNILNCTSPIRACVESTSFNIFFLFHLIGEPKWDAHQ